jgi:hypothetical protein
LRIGHINRLLLVLGSRSLRLAIEIDGVIRIYDVDVIVIGSGLGPAPVQKCCHRGPTASSPPPPGIPEATDKGSRQGSWPPPATCPPSVIEQIIMVIARTVPYLHSAVVPERCHSISIISPIAAIIRLGRIPTAPKMIDSAPLLLAVGPELSYAPVILVPPPVPIVPSIVHGLTALR